MRTTRFIPCTVASYATCTKRATVRAYVHNREIGEGGDVVAFYCQSHAWECLDSPRRLRRDVRVTTEPITLEVGPWFAALLITRDYVHNSPSVPCFVGELLDELEDDMGRVHIGERYAERVLTELDELSEDSLSESHVRAAWDVVDGIGRLFAAV